MKGKVVYGKTIPSFGIPDILYLVPFLAEVRPGRREEFLEAWWDTRKELGLDIAKELMEEYKREENGRL